MQKICAKCNKIGKELGNTALLISSILLLLFGLLVISLFINDTIFFALVSIIWVIFGIYGIYEYSTHPNKCPNCEYKKTMIPLDTPKAQAIIKENNISIPEEVQKASSSQST